MSQSSPFARTRPELSRRRFLGAVGIGASALAATPLLSGCATGEVVPEQAAAVDDAVLPRFVPVEYAAPDIPSVGGSVPGYTSWPTEVVRAVATPPGDGRTIKAMTPLWGTIPDADGNEYYQAVNDLIGSKVEFQITDGNVYGDKLATVLASPRDVPDWVSIPGWNFPPRFGSEIVGNVFADLTPFLAGEKVTKYPHLANIPTDAWKMCVFNGKLYGLPYPDPIVRDAIFYRDDLMSELGITVQVASAEDLLALAQEVTDPSANRWGAEDMWTAAAQVFGVPPEWALVDGKLVNRVETEQYRAALDWTTRFFASGAVHPDAVAGQTGEAKQRFQAGRSLIMPDGTGGWHEALRDNLATNPSYSQTPFDPFPADGGEIVYWKAPGAGMFSFIKKTEDTAMIEQILAAADILAAPFGTLEYQTVNYGVEGVHWDRGDSGTPVPTDLAAKELQPTYIFLADPPVVESKVQYDGYVEAMCGWMAKVSEHLQEPPLYGMQVTEPAQYASIGQPFTDLEADIPRGRKTLADLDEAIGTWRSSGGEELRTFYQNLLDQQ